MELQAVRIPRERVGAIIGPEGATKAEIEQRTGVELRINSEAGSVQVIDKGAYDPALPLKAQDIVRAIGRGFAPDRALRLLQDDAFFEVISLEEHVGRAKDLDRVRARIIGTRGRTRITIEESTGCYVSVFGKTVALIGEVFEMEMAREAVMMLLRGAAHASVYRFLEKKRRELRLRELGLA